MFTAQVAKKLSMAARDFETFAMTMERVLEERSRQLILPPVLSAKPNHRRPGCESEWSMAPSVYLEQDAGLI